MYQRNLKQRQNRSSGALSSFYSAVGVVAVMGALVPAFYVASRFFDRPQTQAEQAKEAPVRQVEQTTGLELKVSRAVPGVAAIPPEALSREPIWTGSLNPQASQGQPPAQVAAPDVPAAKPEAKLPEVSAPEVSPPLAVPSRAPVRTPSLASPDMASLAPVPAPAAPKATVPAPSGPASTALVPPAPAAAAEDDGEQRVRVDLNSASLEQLNRLGAGRIGRAIIEGRPYASSEDLVKKRVLTRTMFLRIKDNVGVGRVSEAQAGPRNSRSAQTSN